MSIFDLTSEGADRLLGFSNIMLVIGLVVALAATIGTIWASAVIGNYSSIRQAETEVAVANASAASKVADARAADANERAAQANERAAVLEKETANLHKQAEEAKAEAAKVNERLQKIQQIRRLSKDQAEALTPLLKSDIFQSTTKPNLRVSSVADAEAHIFAMDLLSLFKSCNINIYPTPQGTFPLECIQTEASLTGLILSVKNLYVLTPTNPFWKLRSLMSQINLTTTIETNSDLQENEAMIYVLRKPNV